MPKKKRLLKRIRGVRELVTEGKELAGHIKDLTARLDEIKTDLRTHAEATEKGFIKGYNKSCVVIEDVDVFTLSPAKLKKKVGPKKFGLLASVSNTKARSELGDAVFESMAKKTTRKWNRVSFHSTDDIE